MNFGIKITRKYEILKTKSGKRAVFSQFNGEFISKSRFITNLLFSRYFTFSKHCSTSIVQSFILLFVFPHSAVLLFIEFNGVFRCLSEKNVFTKCQEIWKNVWKIRGGRGVIIVLGISADVKSDAKKTYSKERRYHTPTNKKSTDDEISRSDSQKGC